jgi:hypothetical protein
MNPFDHIEISDIRKDVLLGFGILSVICLASAILMFSF